jgi:hypothetical protein
MVFVHEYHKSLCRKTAKIIGLRRVVEYSEHYKIARSINLNACVVFRS